MQEDFGDFFNDDEFSEPCELVSLSRTISVIVDNASELVSMSVVDVSASTPIFIAPEADIVDLEVGHLISLRSQHYQVAAVLPDGTGLVVVTYI